MPDVVTGHAIEVLMVSKTVQSTATWETGFAAEAATVGLPSPIAPAGNPDEEIRYNTGFTNLPLIVDGDQVGEVSGGGGRYVVGVPTGGVFLPGTVAAGSKVELDVTDMVKWVLGNTQDNVQADLNMIIKGRHQPVLDSSGNPTPYGWFGGTGESESFLVETLSTGLPSSPASVTFHSMDAAISVAVVEQAVAETRKSEGLVDLRLTSVPTTAFSSTTASADQYLILNLPTTDAAMVRFLDGLSYGDTVTIRNAQATVVVAGRTQRLLADGDHTFRGYLNGRLLFQPGTSVPLFRYVSTGAGYSGIILADQFTTLPIVSRTTDTSTGNRNIIVNRITTDPLGVTTSLEARGVAAGSLLYVNSASNEGIFRVTEVSYPGAGEELIYVDHDLTIENSDDTGTFFQFAVLDDMPRLEITYYE